MKIDNKGMTIVEILVSILIIGIVLVLLFSMLSQVRNEDRVNNVQSNFIINQSTFIKNIEEDIVNYGVKSISPCSLADANIASHTVVTGDEENFKCIRIEYAADYIEDNIGYLMVYHYYTKYETIDNNYKGINPAWMIQYVRGSYKETCLSNNTPNRSSWKNATSLMKEMPSEIDLGDTPYLLYTAMSGTNINAASLVLPIVNTEGEHYDINLSFTFSGNNSFTCDNSNSTKLQCNCLSSNALCTNTYQKYTYNCSK